MVRQLLDVVHPRVGDTGEPQPLLQGVGCFQYDFAEALPFGRILHRQQHRVAITGNERPIRRNRRVARSRE